MSSDDPSIQNSATPANSASAEPAGEKSTRSRSGRPRIVGLVFFLLIAVAGAALFVWQRHISSQMHANLPQIDGSLTVPGLSAPVTVERDAHGVPHLRATSMNDLIFAQGYVTAQDRLWQMDLLRRHAAGALAAILGPSMVGHDRLQRTLQLRAAAARAFAALPPDQKQWLEVYAAGVNASMEAQRDHLPIEFRLIGYTPSPWTPGDSLLVELAMFQDLTTSFTQKLGREALTAHLPPDLVAELYPTGSWRDHVPGQPILDVTAPQPEIPDVPLDESQSRLHRTQSVATGDLLALNRTLALFHGACETCVAGSNGWAVSGSHTASGKPILSSDMHLALAAPGVWYEADLEATPPSPLAEFHVAGVTLPGTPFVIVGHNAHVAWGFTNLGGDVQDLYIEHTRGTPSGAAEYQTASGEWRPVRYQPEIIQVRGSSNVTLMVPLTHHGDVDTPIITSIFPGETRSLSLRWSIYDPANVNDPFFAVDSASDWTTMLSAISTWGGPAQNLQYADDQGHIGYHAVGRIPVRGDLNNPSPISPVPTDATAPDAALHEWAGYIPFDQLPQAFDPADGVLATANSRVTPDGYRYPITLNWMAPYRTERVYKVLEANAAKQHPFTPADMLALQNDVYSDLDKVIAQRLAYAIDHATGPLKDDKSLHQAADLLRNWNGRVDANASAPAIVNAARGVFWPMLLIPKLMPKAAAQVAQGMPFDKLQGLSAEENQTAILWAAYTWGERGCVEEQMLSHTPAHWLPPTYATWDDFLAAVVQRGLRDAKAPKDLSTWQQGEAYPVDIEHQVFSRSKLLGQLIGVPTGTGPQPKSGDGTTVKQSELAFGPSERFTADLADPDHTTLNIVLGQSGNPVSPWYMDQFRDWLRGTTFPLPFTVGATQSTITHRLTLNPR